MSFFNVTKVYKNLLFLAVLFNSIYFSLPYISPFLYSNEVLSLMTYTGYSSLFPLEYMNYLAIIYFFAYSATLIGLMFYKKWSEILFFVFVIFNILLGSAIFGISVASVLEAGVAYVLSLIEGALVCLLLFSDISKKFKRV